MVQAKYRLQASDHQGIKQRAFGGRVVSWSPWRTVCTSSDKETAEAEFEWRSKQGLTRWRLVLGKEVIRKSL